MCDDFVLALLGCIFDVRTICFDLIHHSLLSVRITTNIVAQKYISNTRIFQLPTFTGRRGREAPSLTLLRLNLSLRHSPSLPSALPTRSASAATNTNGSISFGGLKTL